MTGVDVAGPSYGQGDVMRTPSFAVALVALTATLPSVQAAPPLAERQISFDPVAAVTTIVARNAAGRVQRFTDKTGREFAVEYDAQQRVQSVQATGRPHISDIISIGYGADGRILGVRFRSGYTVFFESRPALGTVIRDSGGSAVIRLAGVTQSLDGAVGERTNNLAAVIAALESLLASLG